MLTENQIRFSDSGGVGGQKSHKQSVSGPLFVAIGSTFRIFTKNEIHVLIPTKTRIRFLDLPEMWTSVHDGVERRRLAAQEAALVARQAIQRRSMSGRA